MEGFGEAIAELMSGMLMIIVSLSIISIFGIWKIVELIYWACQHLDINWIT